MSDTVDQDPSAIARLLANARRRADELALLNRINRALTSTLDYGQVLIQILTEVNSILGVEAASVSVIDPEANELVFEYAVGVGSQAVRGMRIPADQGVLGWAVSHGEPIIVADVATDRRFYREVDEESGLSTRSILCAPLRIGNRTIGAIEAVNKIEGQFDDHDLGIIVGVADQAAVALENARLYREVARQSTELEERNRQLVETQERLVKSERLAALGQVGLALRHEINNPLAAILARVDMIQMEHPDLPEAVIHDLEVTAEMAERIAAVVGRLDTLDDRTTTYVGDMTMIDLASADEQDPSS